MERITYGTPRLVDWVAQIKAGGATVRVHFTGGALTQYGVTPAEYTTASPFMQKVIEQSSYFKEGRIIKLRSTKLPDAPKPKGKPKAVAAPQSAPATQTKREKPAAGTPATAAAGTPAPEAAETDAPGSAPEAQGEESATAGLTEVAVTCLPDAQAYLQENFNISSYKIRSYEAAQLAAAEHGIQFTGAKFDMLNAIDKGEEEAATEGE